MRSADRCTTVCGRGEAHSKAASRRKNQARLASAGRARAGEGPPSLAGSPGRRALQGQGGLQGRRDAPTRPARPHPARPGHEVGVLHPRRRRRAVPPDHVLLEATGSGRCASRVPERAVRPTKPGLPEEERAPRDPDRARGRAAPFRSACAERAQPGGTIRERAASRGTATAANRDREGDTDAEPDDRGEPRDGREPQGPEPHTANAGGAFAAPVPGRGRPLRVSDARQPSADCCFFFCRSFTRRSFRSSSVSGTSRT